MLHNEVCEKIGITREELAKILGISKNTIDAWSSYPDRMMTTTKVALSLMIENHELKARLGNFEKFLNSFSYGICNDISQEHKSIIERVKFVMKEYELTSMGLSQKIGVSFGDIEKILSFKEYPTVDFLEKIHANFKINDKWLFYGELTPFYVNPDFLSNYCRYTISDLRDVILNNGVVNYHTTDDANKIQISEIYIIHSTSYKQYTKVVVLSESGDYAVLKDNFCIDDNSVLFATEEKDILRLYEFYRQTSRKGYRIKLLSLDDEDYRDLLDGNHRIDRTLLKGNFSYMLYDLFDLNDSNLDNYGEWYSKIMELLKAYRKKIDNQNF